MNFISKLVSVDEALIFGDHNIHFDNPEDWLRTAFVSALDSAGVIQNIIGPTHHGGHTLDLALTFRLSIENIVAFPQSEDHLLLLFKMCLNYNYIYI